MKYAVCHFYLAPGMIMLLDFQWEREANKLQSRLLVYLEVFWLWVSSAGFPALLYCHYRPPCTLTLPPGLLAGLKGPEPDKTSLVF